MSKLAWLADKLSRTRIAHQTTRHLDSLTRQPVLDSQRAVGGVLAALRGEPGPKVCWGETAWGEQVVVPLAELVQACGIATGGMGSGKTMAACLILQAMIADLPHLRTMGFGILDAKGELFERATYLLGARLRELEGEARAELLRRIVIIDFSSQQAVSPYNISSRWPSSA